MSYYCWCITKNNLNLQFSSLGLKYRECVHFLRLRFSSGESNAKKTKMRKYYDFACSSANGLGACLQRSRVTILQGSP